MDLDLQRRNCVHIVATCVRQICFDRLGIILFGAGVIAICSHWTWEEAAQVQTGGLTTFQSSI